MKKEFYLFLFLFAIQHIGWAQVVCGIVKDAETKQGIAGATIKLKIGRQTSVTDNSGLFAISNAKKRDTIVVSFLGYSLYEAPISSDTNRLEIYLQQKVGQLSQVNIAKEKKWKTEWLGKTGKMKIWQYGGGVLLTEQEQGDYTVFAKQFNAPKNGVRILEIQFEKVYFFGQRSLSHQQKCRFLVNFYALDSVSREPGKKIFSKQVEMDQGTEELGIVFDKKNTKPIRFYNTISFENDTVVVGKYFFVGIEKLYIPFNERIVSDGGKFATYDRVEFVNGNPREYYNFYLPLIAFREIDATETTEETGIWYLGKHGKWCKFMPIVFDNGGTNVAELYSGKRSDTDLKVKIAY